MSSGGELSPDELRARALRFYERYSDDLDQIRSLLELRLRQLARAYTLEQTLPGEAVEVSTRVKSAESFLGKLEDKGWPQFYYPTEVVGDLIGGRVVCWFVSDCHGFVDMLRSSAHLAVRDSVEDYVTTPKPSGYRSVHLTVEVSYDAVRRKAGHIEIVSDAMPCELQVRTKLQDAWADVTHEFHYKAKREGIEDPSLEDLLSDVSDRLHVEDKTLEKFRAAYQRLADRKSLTRVREGFHDEPARRVLNTDT